MGLKRWVSFVVCLSIIFNIFGSTAYAKETTKIQYDGTVYEYTKFPKIYINGQEMKEGIMPPVPTPAQRTLVPVREFFESIGAEVIWNGDSQEVYILHGNNFIVLQIDSLQAMVNGQPIQMDETAKLVKNLSSDSPHSKTMVPLRFLLETLDYEVLWDGDNYAIHAFSKEDNNDGDQDDSNNVEDTDEDKDEDGTVPEDNDNDEDDSDEEQTVGLPTPLKDNPIIWKEKYYPDDDKDDDSTIEYKEYPMTEITGVEFQKDDNDLQFIIKATSEISGIETNIWNDVLIIDIPNSERGFDKDVITLDENPYFMSVRSSQFSTDPMVTRVVFDMKYSDINYKIHMSDDRKELIIKVDRNYVYDIRLKQDKISDYVDITSKSEPVPELLWLSNPTRLVVDIPFSDSAFITKEAKAEGQYVKGIRTAQFDDHTVRIVMDLKEHAEYKVEKISDNTVRVRIIPPTYKNIIYEYKDHPRLVISKEVPGISKNKFTISDDYLSKQALITIPSSNLESVFGYGTININDDHVKKVELYEDEKGYNLNIVTNKIKAFTITEDKNNFYINFLNPKDIYDKIVVIDPGHGGSDPGKPAGAGNYTGLDEKVLNLDIALKVEKLLQQEDDIKVYMTRRVDDYPTLGERCDMANEIGADLFVSIHNNAFFKSVNGTETYYFKLADQQTINVAKAMQKNVVQMAGTKDNGARSQEFYVTRHTVMPSVLVEVAYMTNPKDAELLKSDDFKQNVATGIYKGILESFKIIK